MNQIRPGTFGAARLKPMTELLAQAAQAKQPRQALPPSPALGEVSAALAADRLSTRPLASNPARADLAFVARPLIGPDDRVLHIGDSHTVGVYGREMDKLLRSTGAKVETYGSAGASPGWFFSGQVTRSGFYGKDETGKTDSPADWRTPHATPKLPDLLNRFKPNVVMISLGANLLHASGASIEKQVARMAEAARASGARIIWVGPPDGRESKKPSSKQDALYAHLQKAASAYGDFIDSRPLTDYPASGGDGVHYSGKEGTRIATGWAKEVYRQVQAIDQVKP